LFLRFLTDLFPFHSEFLKNRHGGDFGIDWFFDGDVEENAPIVTYGFQVSVGTTFLRLCF
jgi:hypothetical protein